MQILVLAAMSFALLAAAVALVREVRLRRALQQLVRRLLNLWRRQHEDLSDRSDRAGPGDDGRL
jgi:hypothetical protein